MYSYTIHFCGENSRVVAIFGDAYKISGGMSVDTVGGSGSVWHHKDESETRKPSQVFKKVMFFTWFYL